MKLHLIGTLSGMSVLTTFCAAPFHSSELIFPLEHWHNHGSCVVETPNEDLIVCWFHGSGERTADDVKVEGARWKKGTRQWSERFTMADTPEYPDTNCAMIIDPMERLWLMWPTILANRWESALMKYRISTNYNGEGSPVWSVSEVMHVTPGHEFEKSVLAYLDKVETTDQLDIPPEYRARLPQYVANLRHDATNKLSRRLGWMTRAHPFVLNNTRMIVPLYSDGFSFSLMAYTDDWGSTWKTSNPLIGAGNIQPSIVRKKDGSLYTLMRDNGPAPKRLHQSESTDNGATWSTVTDSNLPNPGSGAEIIGLRNGNWILISNDSEKGRHTLAVQLSEDEGKTWKWTRHLERDGEEGVKGEYHYPSIMQAKDGSLHATYSYFVKQAAGGQGKSIKHAHFNEEWIREGVKK